MLSIGERLAPATGRREEALTRHDPDSERTAELELKLERAEQTRAETLEKLRTARSDLKAERTNHQRLQNELNRRLAIRAEELEDAARRLAAIEATTETLKEAFGELRQEASELRDERGRLAAQLDALMLQNDGLSQTIAAADKRNGKAEVELSILRERIDWLERELERRETRNRRLESLARARDVTIARLELEVQARDQTIPRLELELRARDETLAVLDSERLRTIEEVRRIAGSRAWRWGHRLTRALRRIAFRPSQDQGAVAQLLERLEGTPRLSAGPAATSGDEQPGGQ